MSSTPNWHAVAALNRLALPWLDRGKATISTKRHWNCEDSLLEPGIDGPLSLTVRDYGAHDTGFDVFVGGIPEPFELDDHDERDQREFETLVLAVLEGRVTTVVARTPLGQRTREVVWDDSSWSVPRYLSLASVSRGTHRRVFPGY